MADEDKVAELATEEEPIPPVSEGEAPAEVAGEPPVDYKALAEETQRELAKLKADSRSQRISGLKQAERDARMEGIEQSVALLLRRASGEIDEDAIGPKVAALRQEAQQATQAQQQAAIVAVQDEAYADIVRLAGEAGLDTDPQKLATAPEMRTVMSFWNLATTHKLPEAFGNAVEAARLMAERKKLEVGKSPEARRKPNLDMGTGQSAGMGAAFSGKLKEESLEDDAYWEANKAAILEAYRKGELQIV